MLLRDIKVDDSKKIKPQILKNLKVLFSKQTTSDESDTPDNQNQEPVQQLEIVDKDNDTKLPFSFTVVFIFFAVMLLLYNSETTYFLDKLTFINPFVFSIVKIILTTVIFASVYKLTTVYL
jgi:hypothetical protein